MPTHQRHRGKHPLDDKLFATDRLPTLRRALSELCWLLTRGYSQDAAVKVVGDRHSLQKRQRLALLRCACTDQQLESRSARRVAAGSLADLELAIDGFNCLITVEAALSGGLLFLGRDGSVRDLASVHGSYRRVVETETALDRIGAELSEVRSATWYFDRPVSNSARLAALVRQVAAQRGWCWQTSIVYNPDRALVGTRDQVVASSDGWVLDHCGSWIDLPARVLPEETTTLDLRFSPENANSCSSIE